MKKIIVAHPGKQHSFRTATALEMNNSLFKYITTIYDKPLSFTNRLNKILKGDAQKKGKGRRCEYIPDNKVKQFCEIRSLMNLFVSKISVPKRFKAWFNDSLADSFGKKVAKYAIDNNVDMVIMYDCTATKCFNILKKKAPNIKRVLDVSIAHRAFMKVVYEKDMMLTNSNALREDFWFLWNDKKMNRYKQEIYDTDYFFVPSEFVKESIKYLGVDDSKIIKIPYGVDIEKFDMKQWK